MDHQLHFHPHVNFSKSLQRILTDSRTRAASHRDQERTHHIASMQKHVGNLVLALVGFVAPVTGQVQVVTDSIPGTLIRWNLVPVSGGSVIIPDGDSMVTAEVGDFLIGQTEVTWEMYDVFLLRLDLPREARAQVAASARPSRPYGAPDAGFGHRGYPVISITHDAGLKYAAWLSERTGHRYAVATDAQWTRAALLAYGQGGGSDAPAWTADNSEGTTHPVGSLPPDQLGTHDLLGNAGEWVTGVDGRPWLRGGRYLDSSDSVSVMTRQRPHPDWNRTDPQIPKSRWWLSDAPFAGFRLVRLP
jgi:formylglycine-generating enzyme required for sulfatase activity